MVFKKVVAFDKTEFGFSKKLIKSKEKIHPPGQVYKFGDDLPKKVFESQKEVLSPSRGSTAESQKAHEAAARQRPAEADRAGANHQREEAARGEAGVE